MASNRDYSRPSFDEDDLIDPDDGTAADFIPQDLSKVIALLTAW